MAPDAQLLAGKVVAVTGSTSGIGRAVAIAAAAQGAAVMVTGRDDARGAAVVSTIERAHGRAFFRHTDLGELGEAEAFVESTIARFGRIDVLVNAAGTFPGMATRDVTPAIWDEALATNLRAVFFAGKAALEWMAAHGSGSVINISSVGAFVGFPDAALYCATKGAIESLTRAWAREYGARGVTVNAVAPGTVDTPMSLPDPEQRAFLERLSIVGRLATPEEVAPAVIFLASGGARYIMGESIVVDGGWRVNGGS
jgi:NAD(P)-dependent dehydrogenase (short-subunit alcohol dehydrogenase family)